MWRNAALRGHQGGRARLRSSLPPSTSNQRRANGARDSRAEPGGQEEVRLLVLLRSSPTTHPPPPHSQDKPIGWLGTPPTAGSTTRACERTRRCVRLRCSAQILSKKRSTSCGPRP